MRRFIILSLTLVSYLTCLAGATIPSESTPGINWITIWLSFFFGLFFTILFRFLNRRSKKIDQRSDPGIPLNGWIIFLGINLLFRMVIQLYFFSTAGYFSKSFWTSLAHTGGVKLQTLIIFELFLSLFALTGTGALIYWFLGRRDIFPSMFVYYVTFYLLATLSLIFIYQNITLPADMIDIRRNNLFHAIRIIYATALMIFVLKSKQVRQTFVYGA